VSLFPVARRRALALVVPLVLTLASCGSAGSAGSSEESHAGSTSYEPVTIKHAFGKTTIEEQPERVVSWGWASADAAIALGVAPVAMPRFSYGANDAGLMPWTAQALQAKGMKTPTLLSESQEAPFEEIAEAAPDVILANYSGITKKEYETLSKIAPTVAYPKVPWSTPWRDVITTTGKVLGKSEEVQFLEDLGLTLAPSVDRLATDESSFFYTLSLENLDRLGSDVLVSYSDSEQRAEEVVGSEPLQVMPQVRSDAVANIAGEANVASVSPPTALSLTWSLDNFVSELSDAAKSAQSAPAN
jgi:iron complex transport system substrate-binding protein